MSRAFSSGDAGGAPLRLVVPDSPELMHFLLKVYARENSELAGGSAASLADYKTQVRSLQKFFDLECLEQGQLGRPIRLADITKPLLAGCLAWMIQRGRKATTANKLLRTILAIHRFGIVETELPGKVLHVAKLPELERKPRAWRPNQIGQILTAAWQMPPVKGSAWCGKHDYALVLFILNTGTRISATMETPSRLLEFDAGQVTVPAEVQKHKSDETFDLTDETLRALKAIEPWKHTRIFDAWPHDRVGQKRKWRALTKRLKLILVKAGLFASINDIPPYKELFHKLRRCFATFIAAKHGRRAATDRCGHSTEEVTKRYLDETQLTDRPSCRDALEGKIPLPHVDLQRQLFNKHTLD
jgi:site-specific recombinase XerD